MNDRDAELRTAAQTTVQLYEQLQRHGLGDGDLRAIRAACRVALQLYAGTSSDEHRSHLSHCIGTASTLAALDMPAELVAAGVVHAAYERGDFGPWRVFLRQKRQRLRRLVGAPVARYVDRFHAMAWHPDAVCGLRARVAELDELDRGAALLRLANELDNLGNRAILYRQDYERLRAEALRKRPALIDLAEGLGVPALGRAIADAIDAVRDGDVAPQLRVARGAGVRAPESATIRLETTVTRRIAGGLRRLRRASS